MITGFNTDVEHEGTVYHVQTEDKGLDTPLILSLVYVGGAILASKRSRYDDLIEKGFDEKELAERLNRQHKLICAAIRTGRIDDLKRMSQREGSAAAVAATPTPATAPAPAPEKVSAKPAKPAPQDEADPLEIPPLETAPEKTAQVAPPVKAQPTPKAQPKPATAPPPAPPPSPRAATPEVKVKKATPAQKGAKQNVRAILQDVVADFARAEAASEGGLHLSLVDEKEFRGGATAILKIRVARGAGGKQTISGADVTVKVLGSTFRPLIFPTQTGPDGIALVRAALPHFKTGRAAILVRAIADGYEAELRRIIQQG